MIKGFLISLLCLLLLCFSGCATISEENVNSVRTFSPDGKEEPSSLNKESEKRGILKRLVSPGETKCAYIFTYDAGAEVVEYNLAILDKNETFGYMPSDVIYTSKNLFEIEWGDELTLMVSLHEKESTRPASVDAEGVTVMFGQLSLEQ